VSADSWACCSVAFVLCLVPPTFFIEYLFYGWDWLWRESDLIKVSQSWWENRVHIRKCHNRNGDFHLVFLLCYKVVTSDFLYAFILMIGTVLVKTFFLSQMSVSELSLWHTSQPMGMASLGSCSQDPDTARSGAWQANKSQHASPPLGLMCLIQTDPDIVEARYCWDAVGWNLDPSADQMEKDLLFPGGGWVCFQGAPGLVTAVRGRPE
jgi:hypothetical protein